MIDCHRRVSVSTSTYTVARILSLALVPMLNISGSRVLQTNVPSEKSFTVSVENRIKRFRKVNAFQTFFFPALAS